MPVGVFPWGAHRRRGKSGLPHARGGVSGMLIDSVIGVMSSPCPWGCFESAQSPGENCRVFPMPVGVFLNILFYKRFLFRLPHARRDSSCTIPQKPKTGCHDISYDFHFDFFCILVQPACASSNLILRVSCNHSVRLIRHLFRESMKSGHITCSLHYTWG